MWRPAGLASLLSIAMLCCIGVVGARAQPAPGSTVRVTREGDVAPLTGVLSSATPEAWTVTEPSGRVTEIPLSVIRYTELRVRQRHTLRGAAIGGGVGLVTGLLLAVSVHNDCDQDTTGLCDALVRGPVTGIAILWTPVAGAAAGALIGTLVTSDRWVPVVVPRGGSGRVDLTWTWTSPR